MILETSKKEITCKGLFWRAEVSSYADNNYKIGVRKILKLLKRKSCKGCIYCGWVSEFLHEDVFDNPTEDYLENIKHGKLYTYALITSKGFDQHTELEGIDFIEVKED